MITSIMQNTNATTNTNTNAVRGPPRANGLLKPRGVFNWRNQGLLKL